MRRIRDLLRLKYAQGLSDRATALSLGLSKGTVGNYLARFSQAGLSWPLPPELDDDGNPDLLRTGIIRVLQQLSQERPSALEMVSFLQVGPKVLDDRLFVAVHRHGR